MRSLTNCSDSSSFFHREKSVYVPFLFYALIDMRALVEIIEK